MEFLDALKENWSAVAANPWPFFIGVFIAAIGVWKAMEWLYRGAITRRDETIATHDQRVAKLDQQAVQRKAQIEALEGQVKDRDEQIKAQDDAATDRDMQLMLLTDELRDAKSKSAPAPRPALRFYGGGEAVPIKPAKSFEPGKDVPVHFLLDQMDSAFGPRRLNVGQKSSIPLSLAGVKGRVQIIATIGAVGADGLCDDLRRVFVAAGWLVETSKSRRPGASRAGLILGVGDPDNLTVIETRVIEALVAADLPHDVIRSASKADVQIRIVTQQN